MSRPGRRPGRLRDLRRLPDLDPDDRPGARAAGRRGVARRRRRLGRPGRRLGRLRPGRAALDLGLRAAPRRVRRLGRDRCRGWPTRPTWSPGTPTSATCAELAAAGVPVVPTAWVGPGDRWRCPPTASGWSSRRSAPAAWTPAGTTWPTRSTADLAAGHVARLQAAGRMVMVQPYLAAVDTDGETALLYLGRRLLSHAIRKGPMLTGPDLGVGRPVQAGGDHRPRRRRRRAAAVAERTLAAVPGGRPLLYARVDLIPGPDGEPLLVELELTEPSLFLGYADGARPLRRRHRRPPDPRRPTRPRVRSAGSGLAEPLGRRGRARPAGPRPALGRAARRPRCRAGRGGARRGGRRDRLALAGDHSTARVASQTRQEPSMCAPTSTAGRWVKYCTKPITPCASSTATRTSGGAGRPAARRRRGTRTTAPPTGRSAGRPGRRAPGRSSPGRGRCGRRLVAGVRAAAGDTGADHQHRGADRGGEPRPACRSGRGHRRPVGPSGSARAARARTRRR